MTGRGQPSRLVGCDTCSFTGRAGQASLELLPDAWSGLLRILGRTSDIDRRESGGLVVGPPFWEAALVHSFTAPARVPSPNETATGRTSQAMWSSRIACAAGPVRAIGCWHSHPGGDRFPSGSDLELWAAYLEGLRLERLAALIAVRDGESWGLERFVVTAPRAEGARAVCELARE